MSSPFPHPSLPSSLPSLPPPPSLLLPFSSYGFSYSILSLRALDHHVISDEEIIENLHTNNSTFAPMTHHFRLQLHKQYAKVHPLDLSGYFECNLGRRSNGWEEGGMVWEEENGWEEGGMFGEEE